MAKPGFVEARPKGGGEIRLVPEHYLTNPALGFVEVPSIRATGAKAKARPSDNVEEGTK